MSTGTRMRRKTPSGVGPGVGVAVGVIVGVGVTVAVGVRVGVGEGVSVAVSEGVTVGLMVGVGDAVGWGGAVAGVMMGVGVVTQAASSARLIAAAMSRMIEPGIFVWSDRCIYACFRTTASLIRATRTFMPTLCTRMMSAPRRIPMTVVAAVPSSR